jgi:cobyric acid synthase
MVHGLFEDETLRRAALTGLRARKAGHSVQAQAQAQRVSAYDRVADALAEHCDMAAIEALVGL